MRVRRLGLAILAALVAQTTIAWLLGSARANVDLPLVVVVLAALDGGPLTGFLTGAIAGCGQDWLSGGIVGVSGVSKSLVGLATGVVATYVYTTGILFQGLAIAVATVVHIWAFVALYALMPQAGPSGSWDVVLMQTLANAAVGLAVLAVVRYGPRPPDAEEMQRRTRQSGS